MSNVVIYTKDLCPYCRMAKELLTARNIAFKEIRVDTDSDRLNEMIARSNRRTVPQIFINEKSIGGYDELTTLIKAGKLDGLLSSSQG